MQSIYREAARLAALPGVALSSAAVAPSSAGDALLYSPAAMEPQPTPTFADSPPRAPRPRWGLHVALFAATCLTTFLAGLGWASGAECYTNVLCRRLSE